MMNTTDLMTQDGFSAFLHAYHQRLHDERSFPPLGVQKALHTASPIFGYKNWQAMSASNNWNLSQTQNQSHTCVALVIEYRHKETDLQLFPNELDACAYLFDLISVDPHIYLKGENGDEALFVDVRPRSYPLEKWMEFAAIHLNATINTQTMSMSGDSKTSHNPECALSFDVHFVGDHQSPYSEELQFSGTEEDVYFDLIDLFANDLGAMDLLIKGITAYWAEKLDGEESAFEHRIQETRLYGYILETGEDADKTGIVLALRRAIGDRVFTKEEFMDFYEAAASVEIKNVQFSIDGVSDPDNITENAKDVANHLLEMQEKYGFQNDADSVREAIEESANLLNITLSEDEIVQARDRVLYQ